MTPTYLNSSPSLFSHDLKEDQHHQVLLSTPNPNSSSSSSSLSCHIFFNSSTRYHKEQQEGDNFATNGGSNEIENESHHSGLKFSIWKEEIMDLNQSESTTTNIHKVKWMSSKMRLMHKMKKSDRTVVNAPTSTSLKVEDDQKQPISISPLENDNYSINTSSSSSNHSNPIIRVCSDCNTTKTPLWRSGPRGPKSLCNACGIRQRKARRAMAAVAATNGTIFPTETSTLKITKVQHKDKRSNTGQKRCKLAVAPPPPPSQGREKLCFEDFLITLSKNLAFHRVFPQDEKEAAILLMALSCGHVHG